MALRALSRVNWESFWTPFGAFGGLPFATFKVSLGLSASRRVCSLLRPSPKPISGSILRDSLGVPRVIVVFKTVFMTCATELVIPHRRERWMRVSMYGECCLLNFNPCTSIDVSPPASTCPLALLRVQYRKRSLC